MKSLKTSSASQNKDESCYFEIEKNHHFPLKIRQHCSIKLDIIILNRVVHPCSTVLDQQFNYPLFLTRCIQNKGKQNRIVSPLLLMIYMYKQTTHISNLLQNLMVFRLTDYRTSTIKLCLQYKCWSKKSCPTLYLKFTLKHFCSGRFST